jgi:hypothetical protein
METITSTNTKAKRIFLRPASSLRYLVLFQPTDKSQVLRALTEANIAYTDDNQSDHCFAYGEKVQTIKFEVEVDVVLDRIVKLDFH